MQSNLISIIIPTYNRADLLPETLDSVLSQTYENWECIIVDDGSSDHTPKVAHQYSQKDSRFKFHQRPTERKSGGNGARNFGFLQSTGNYVKWLDSDDLIAKDLLQKEIQLLSEENADLILSSWIYFDSANTHFPERNRLVKAAPHNGIELLNKMGELGEFSFPSCYLVKRDLVAIAGLWNENLRVNQDGEFFFRIISNCNNLRILEYCGSLHRKDGENKISQKADHKSISNRINSWKLIDAMIQIRKNPQELQTYISGTKTILYNEQRDSGKLDVILENSDFFKEQIRSEKSRKMKLKLMLLKLKKS